MNMIIYTWLFSLLVCLKKKGDIRRMFLQLFSPWHECSSTARLNWKSLLSSTPDLCCLVRLHIVWNTQQKTTRRKRKSPSLCSSSSSSRRRDSRLCTFLLVCHFSLLRKKEKKKRYDFLILRTFLFVLGAFLFVFLPSCWGILSDSSRTGILDAHRSSCLRDAVWRVPRSPRLAEPRLLGARRPVVLSRQWDFNILDASPSDWF